MTTLLRNLWRIIWGQTEPKVDLSAVQPELLLAADPFELLPGDPLFDFLQRTSGTVELDRLDFDSPALRNLRAAGVKLVLPLVSQGELIGLLNLDKRLTSQAAPIVRVAQLVYQQQREALAHERLEQELRIARLIQQTLLPKENPRLPGWAVTSFYQPARTVGGDFYDFLLFPDGMVGFIIGDVTDKGVPAALVMAITRTMLRATAERLIFPGQVLERVNDLLQADIPPKMFVTCLYALLDPATGRLCYANAGHDLPYRRRSDGVDELRATGMPLGLMPGMRYEEKETVLAPGETMLLYSDGLVEAHNAQREMFGFPRLQALVAKHEGGPPLIDFLITQLAEFTGPAWEQEDDVTMVLLQHCLPETGAEPPVIPGENQSWRTLAEFSLVSILGNEREAMRRVGQAVQPLSLSDSLLDRLKTAVAEATMNAIEHGNKNQPDLPVVIQVQASPQAVRVRITDQGGGQPIPEPEAPNLEAKLAGLQTPRGWGLFLIKNLTDEMRVMSDDTHHTIELTLYLEAEKNVSQTS